MQATAQFEGSIPAIYEAQLGPYLFQWSARELAERVEVPQGGRLLEIACGTGIATEALRHALCESVEIVATDLNEGMLAEAGERRPDLVNVSYSRADAQALPFEDASFDSVVCQFGLMFFADPIEALREARRVVKPGGQVIFSTWDCLEDNPAVLLVHETIQSFFPEDPPAFLETAFGLHDPQRLRALFAAADARYIDVEPVEHVAELSSARPAASGLVRGNPGVLEIEARGGTSPEHIVEVAKLALEERFGSAPFVSTLRAIFVSARR